MLPMWQGLVDGLSCGGRVVHVRADKQAMVQGKFERLVQEGPGKLHIISDFDMTLTKWGDASGKRSVSSHGILTRATRHTTPEFKARTTAYYDRYYPMEVSTTLPHAQRVLAMEEWWTLAHAEVLKIGLTRAHIRDMVGGWVGGCVCTHVSVMPL